MFNITPLDDALDAEISQLINNKTKPLGSLGKLETLAFQICKIQKSLSPELKQPQMLVFAADHGICEEGVSPFPQEVTQQMVLNFLAGGAAINCLCEQNGIEFRVVNSGVKASLPEHVNLINAPIAKGTLNFLKQPAMSRALCEKALLVGADLVLDRYNRGANIIGFGEMGIGNTTSAAAIMSVILNLPAKECAGKGTGLDDEGVSHKADVIERAKVFHQDKGADPITVLATYGGYEIAMMTGAMLKAAELGMVVLVDGFIASSAALLAHKINVNFLQYTIFCHQSGEKAHKKMLKHMGVSPLLDLGMRLGEGSGVAVAYPVILGAVTFARKMASFDSAGVSRDE